MEDQVYNQYVGKHGKTALRVGHDIFLRWFVVSDGKWRALDGVGTLRQALEQAHALLHDGNSCSEKLDWKLDEQTKARTLSACPKCSNPSTDSDLSTYRSCADCGWRVNFTDEEKAWLENRLKPERW